MLSLFAAIINKLKERMQSEVPRIFEAVFECTLTMITKNFEVRVVLASRRGVVDDIAVLIRGIGTAALRSMAWPKPSLRGSLCCRTTQSTGCSSSNC